MPVNPKSLKNLQDRSAPDKPGETTTITFRLSIEDLEWFRSLPEGCGYHLRQAAKRYREEMERDRSNPSEDEMRRTEAE